MRIAVVKVVPMVGSVRGARLRRSIDAPPADQGHLTTTESTIGTPEATRGLTSTDAMQRLAISGPNALPKTTPPTLMARVAKQLVNPLSAILLAAGFITIVVLRRSGEGASILVIVVINTAVAVRQERAANDAMAALEQLVAPTSKVWRDGLLQEILAEGLVADDLIELAAGDRVPADARVAQSSLMAVDEAMLTGESLPVDKIAQDQVFAGTLVVRGSGQGVVAATGAATKLGQIATAMEKPTDPPLVRELSVIAAQVSLLAIVVGVLVGIGTYARNAGQQKRTAEAVLTGVALAIAAIPEGLSSVVLSALALGTTRMAKRGVIVRRLPAIEALGSTSVLCADKTGTITSGHLEVVDLLVQPGLDENSGRPSHEPTTLSVGSVIHSTSLCLMRCRHRIEPKSQRRSVSESTRGPSRPRRAACRRSTKARALPICQ